MRKQQITGRKIRVTPLFLLEESLFIYLAVIYLALFLWLTSPLGQLASHRDGAGGKRAVGKAQERRNAAAHCSCPG